MDSLEYPLKLSGKNGELISRRSVTRSFIQLTKVTGGICFSVVFWSWPLPVQLDYGKEATPTVTAVVSLFDQMANALVQKRQKKKKKHVLFL